MSYKKDSIRKPFPFYITDELKERIKRKADKEGRSVNGLINYAVKFYLEITEK